MKTTIIHCDVCRQTIPYRGWETECSPFFVSSRIHLQNRETHPFEDCGGKRTNLPPQSGPWPVNLDLQDVCPRCQRHLAESIAATIQHIVADARKDRVAAPPTSIANDTTPGSPS